MVALGILQLRLKPDLIFISIIVLLISAYGNDVHRLLLQYAVS